MLLAILSCAALLAGCGSSSSSSTSSSTPTASTPAASTPTTSTSSGATPSSAQVQIAVEECKKIVASQATLPQAAKEKLEGACSKAAKGDTNAVKQAAREVCEEVINKSPLPASAKEAAAVNCKK